MSDSHLVRGLLDTSVVIDFGVVDGALLPDETAISAVTLAELAAGPHAARDDLERSRRQDRLHWAASHWAPVPFDAAAGGCGGPAGGVSSAGGGSGVAGGLG